MIKIHDKLWYTVREDSEDNLSYMSQYEETSTGDIAANVKKMQKTGRWWSRNGKEEIIDNLPTANIYVGNSVSRWSTSNKVFRVKDPRGFTVEIPTDNLATLLHHTTVVKGVVQEECVWGRVGGNHILLPVNSEPYTKVMKNMDTIENKLIPVSELKVGDWVKFFGSDKELYFFGRVKVTFNVRSHIKPPWYNRNIKERYSDWHSIEDDKYTNIFLWDKTNNDGDYYSETPPKPKIVEVLRNEVMNVDCNKILWINAPERVINKLHGVIDMGEYARYESEIISVRFKGE